MVIIFTQLLSSLRQHLTSKQSPLSHSKQSPLSHLHPVLGWISASLDRPMQPSMPLGKASLCLLRSCC